MIVNAHGTMDMLATMLAGPTGRPVLNKTRLEGLYLYALQYAQLNTSTDANGAPDVFAALEQQLGLKLESAKAPIPVLIIDHAERVPTGN
jgi:uncharacterized protein (TIGR03435 family)